MILARAGAYEEAEATLGRGLSLARSAGAWRYQSAILYVLALIRVAHHARKQAREYLAEALDLAQQTGIGFLGPAIYAALAGAAESAPERRNALRNGEALLRQPCVGHCHLWFYKEAIEATLAAGEWNESRRYADALEAYVRAEPLPWALLVAARGRTLAAAGAGARDAATLIELRRVRAEATRAGMGSLLPGLDAALAVDVTS